jgi:hypothetical protein
MYSANRYTYSQPGYKQNTCSDPLAHGSSNSCSEDPLAYASTYTSSNCSAYPRANRKPSCKQNSCTNSISHVGSSNAHSAASCYESNTGPDQTKGTHMPSRLRQSPNWPICSTFLVVSSNYPT